MVPLIKYLGFQNFKCLCCNIMILFNMMILFTLQCLYTQYLTYQILCKSSFLNWKEIMVDDSHSYLSGIEGIESVRNWAQKRVTETWKVVA